MRTLFTKLAVAASFLLYSSGAMAQCLTAASTYTDLNGAGGAPCFDGTTCAITNPDFTANGIGVYGSEAYLLDNVNAGSDYVFSMCQGIGFGSWIPSITIVTPSGAVDAYNAGSTGNFAANCSISWTATESGTYSIVIHEAGLACGVETLIDNGNPTVTCGGNPAPCTIVPCDAGILDISASPIALCPGESFDMATDGSESTNGAYAIFISPQAGATGGLEGAIFLSPVQSFPVTGIDNDLGGILSTNSFPPLVGTFAFYSISYDDVNDAQGSVCSISADSILVTFLTANDAACIPCTADAGTITAVETPVCFLNGSAVIAGTPDGNSVVPAGYSTGYAVTDASGTVIQVGLSPSFTVTAVGSYTIHTLVYDPTTLNPLALPPGITAAQANALLIQGGGTICASLDLVGAPIIVEVCATCDADAGTITPDASPICLANGSADISATADGNAVVPAGYSTLYVLTEGSGLVIEGASATPNFTVTAGGNFTIHTLIYDPLTLDISIVQFGVTTGFDVNSLLLQGGGVICGSLDVAGAPITVEAPDAGTITPDASSVCLANGSADISATADGNAVVPAGYSTLYVLTEGAGLVIVGASATPNFNVTTGGDYTIHTLIYDPLTLDISIVQFGVTTGFDVNGLLQQGGGVICGSLDVAGAPITVEAPDAGTLSAGAQTCLVNGSGTVSATPDGNTNVPAGYSVGFALTDALGNVLQVGITPSFPVTTVGFYTVHTLVYDPNTLNPLALPPGITAAQANALLVQGGGTICASLDLVGATVEVIACAPCDAEAGTITPDASPVCLANGSADISATADGNEIVPAGYSTLYVLTEGAGLVIVGASATPNFNVTTGGDYTIHTLIYDPLTLDISIVQFGVTTGFDVNGLLQQGGGVICGSLDVAGAPITVEAPDAGTLSAAAQTCLVNGSGTVSATPDGNTNVPAGYSVGFALTDALGNVLQVGLTPSFPVTTVGFYTVHTLVYDPSTLNPLALPPGITAAQANALLVQGGGTICASLDLVGATVEVIACAQCDADAGTITSDASPVCFENGTADISATADGNAVVPAGYSTLYVLTEGSGLVIVDAGATPNFTVTATGDYTIHTLVFDPLTLDISIVQFGVTTGFDVNSLLQQGGGVICASLDVAGAPTVVEVCVVPCTASAGTITADASPVCLANGSADISGTANGNSVVPAGYQTLYVLTQGAGLVIVDAGATPDFTVNAAGNYTIHTLVYDPTTLDVSIVQFGVTTGFQVNGLLQQGGGLICASLDVVGAPIVVQNCSTGCNVTAGTLITSSSLVCLFEGAAVLAATHIQTPTYPIGYEVLYILTEGAGLVVQDSYIFPTFTVSAGGSYTIHTLVYDPLILDPATIGTGIQLNSLLLQGGGTICGALDVAGAAITVPVLESTVGVLLNDGDSLYLENGTGLTDYQWFLNGNPIPGAIGTSYVIEESGNYAVQYTGENGCIQSSSTSPFTFSGGNIGFEEHDLFSAVSVFPNPSNGLFSVRTELKNRTDVTISITDITGRVLAPSIMLQDVNQFTHAMDVSHLSAGFYLVRIEASEGATTVRFMKQ